MPLLACLDRDATTTTVIRIDSIDRLTASPYSNLTQGAASWNRLQRHRIANSVRATLRRFDVCVERSWMGKCTVHSAQRALPPH